MALVNCTECGGEISTAAPACPHCGKVRRRYKNSRGVMLVFWLLAAAFGLLWGVGGGSPIGGIVMVLSVVMFFGTIFDVLRGRA